VQILTQFCELIFHGNPKTRHHQAGLFFGSAAIRKMINGLHLRISPRPMIAKNPSHSVGAEHSPPSFSMATFATGQSLAMPRLKDGSMKRCQNCLMFNRSQATEFGAWDWFLTTHICSAMSLDKCDSGTIEKIRDLPRFCIHRV
jgi:hypothetical protein